MALNEQVIKAAIKQAAAKRQRLEIVDTTYAGLRIRISPTGTATSVLGCRDKEGRARRYPVGPWPDKGVAAARDAARLLRADVAKGANPIFEARQERATARLAAEGIGSLAGVLGLYEANRGRTLKSWADCKRRIESVFGRQLKRPLMALTRPELQLAADQWPSAQSAAAAVRYLRPVLKNVMPSSQLD